MQATLLTATFLIAAIALPAHASGFTDFADDENACRHAGTAAIAGATGATAAHRYDAAYQRCMFNHVRARHFAGAADRPPFAPPLPPDGHFPDAYYSVPYATPGYGYDGFSYGP